MNAFLTERTSRVKIENVFSKTIGVMSEVPQGLVLGPLLLIAYTADLKHILTSSLDL